MSNSPPTTPTSDNNTRGSSDAMYLTRNGRPKPGPIRALEDIPEFPGRHEGVPAYLSCKEVCRQYPNNLRDDILDCFLHYNWSARQIFDALAPTAKSWMTSNHTSGEKSRSPYNVLSKRLEKRRARHTRAGVLDEVMAARNVRPEGQGPHFRGAGRIPLQARRQAIESSRHSPVIARPINSASSDEPAATWADAAGPFNYPQYDRARSDFAGSSTMFFDDTDANFSYSDYHTDFTDFSESSGIAFDDASVDFPNYEYYSDVDESSGISFADDAPDVSTSEYHDTVSANSEAFNHGQSIVRPSAPPPLLYDLDSDDYKFPAPADDIRNAHDPGSVVDNYQGSYSHGIAGQSADDQGMSLHFNGAMTDDSGAAAPGQWHHDSNTGFDDSSEPPSKAYEYPDPTESQLTSYFDYDVARGQAHRGYGP